MSQKLSGTPSLDSPFQAVMLVHSMIGSNCFIRPCPLGRVATAPLSGERLEHRASWTPGARWCKLCRVGTWSGGEWDAA